MFDTLINGINTQYQPNIYQPKYPECKTSNSSIQSLNINKPYEVKSSNGDLKGYFWYYGNSVDLTFTVTGEIVIEPCDSYIDISQVINTLDLSATIWDINHNQILYFSNGLDAEYPLEVSTAFTNSETGEVSITVTVPITKELSTLKMAKGIYHVDLIANHPSGYCETLFSSNTCTFEVR